MTIAIACAFKDGVLFCADNKITTGQEKSFESKIFARQWEAGRCVTVFTGSGNTDYLIAVVEKLERALASSVDFSRTSLDQIQDKIELVLARFHRLHLFPNPNKDLINLSLLIGLWLNGETRILASTDATLRRVYGYECVGAGGYLARYWLREALGSGTTFNPDNLTVEEASLILQHAIDSTVDYDEACDYEDYGGEAEYMGMMHNGSIGDIRANAYLGSFPAQLRSGSWGLLRELAKSKDSIDVEIAVDKFCAQVREDSTTVSNILRSIEEMQAKKEMS